jgi:hypothetical protein
MRVPLFLEQRLDQNKKILHQKSRELGIRSRLKFGGIYGSKTKLRPIHIIAGRKWMKKKKPDMKSG